jgi:hypothetical protein
LQAAEPRPTPKERYQRIQSDVLEEIIKYRDKCSSWEDVVDVCDVYSLHTGSGLIVSQQLSYQGNTSLSLTRTFSRLPLGDSPSASNALSETSFRLRFGRSRRLVLDRHVHRKRKWQVAFEIKDAVTRENVRRYEELWRYDESPTPERVLEETDRFILDDFDAK